MRLKSTAERRASAASCAATVELVEPHRVPAKMRTSQAASLTALNGMRCAFPDFSNWGSPHLKWLEEHPGQGLAALDQGAGVPRALAFGTFVPNMRGEHKKTGTSPTQSDILLRYWKKYSISNR